MWDQKTANKEVVTVPIRTISTMIRELGLTRLDMVKVSREIIRVDPMTQIDHN